jgi:ABC-type nickel/cobalt efflux system permease component RcnA
LLSLFGLGFLLGMQHALEVDHIAALASLTTGEGSSKRVMALGATWGLGHASTLLLFGGAVLFFGFQLDEQIAGWLEFAVGGMLVGLGARVLLGLWRERVHIHVHRHDDGTVHMYAHGHKYGHRQSPHTHGHRQFSPGSFFRILAVGVMHGMAGTAALIVFVAAASVGSILLGIGYIGMFGLGSVLGMAALSVVIFLPSTYAARTLPKLGRVLKMGVGVGTSALGGYVMVTNWAL